MAAAALAALSVLADPFHLAMLVAGVLAGLVTGVIPGLGGLVGMTLLLPFTYKMDPVGALALMVGVHAVVSHSDAIPAILFGVPGTVGSAATVLDGFPMARRGEARRAFGAAFTANVLGGLIGAAILALSIPVLQPFMLAIGSPEMLAFALFGLSFAAVLAGTRPLRGLACVALGLLLAMVGEDTQSGTLRWTFDTLYLWEGIPIVPVALALFAIPELAELAIRRSAIAGATPEGATRGQLLAGVRDTLRNPRTVLRSAAIGSLLGAVPGLGANVIDWLAYGAAFRAARKGVHCFGAGDVRGVIASEAANNAKEGGSLIPVLVFGVPGSAHVAIMLGVFLMHAITPGPEMLTTHLDITFSLVWSLVLANIIGAALCFAGAGGLARIARLPIEMLAPLVIALLFLGTVQGQADWGDLATLIGLGAAAFVLKRLGWPRPPLLLGFVLGKLIERTMFTSLQVYGWSWTTRPVVMVVLAMALWGLLSPAIGAVWRRGALPGLRWHADRLGHADTWLAALLACLFAAALASAAGWPADTKLVPDVVAWAGLVFCLLYLAERLLLDGVDAEPPQAHLPPRRVLGFFAWLLGFAGAAWLLGVLPVMGVFVLAWVRADGRSWRAAVGTAIGATALAWLLFDRVLQVAWPPPALGTFW